APKDTAAAEKVAAEKAAAEKAAAEKAAAEKVAAEKVAAEKVAAEKAAAEKAAAEKAAAEKAAAEKAAAEKAAAEKAAAEKVAAEKAAAEKAAAEKAAAEKAAAEKAAAEKAAAEKAAAEKAAAEKVAAEKVAAEKAAKDRLKELKPMAEITLPPTAAEKEALAKKLAAEKAAAEKAAAAKAALDQKLAAEKEAAEKALAEKEALEQKLAREREVAEKAAEEKAALEQKLALEREAAKKAAEEKASVKQMVTEEKQANEKVAAEKKALAQKLAAEKAAAEKAAAEKDALAKKLASEREAAEKAAAEKDALAKKLAVEREAAEKVAVEKTALVKSLAAEKEAADKVVAEKDALAKTLAAEREAAGKAAAEKATLARKVAAEKETAEKAAAEKVALEQKLAAEKAAAEKAAAEKAALEQKLAVEREATQKVAEEKAALEQTLAQKREAKKKAAEERAALKKKMAEEKAAAKKLVAEKAALEKKLAAEKAAVEREAVQKAAAEKAAAEKAEAERIAAEKAAASKAAAEKAAEKAALQKRQKAIENYRRVLREASPYSEVATKARARLKEMGALDEADLPSALVAKDKLKEMQPMTEVTVFPGKTDEKGGEGFLTVTQAASVEVKPLVQLLTSYPGEVAILPLKIVNTGNAEDSFRLEALHLADYQASFFLDKIEDGQLQPFEKQINVTPPVPSQKSIQVLLVLHTPQSLADGQAKEFEVRSMSLYNPSATHVAKAKLVATAPVVRGNLAASRDRIKPTDDLSYTLAYSNQGSALVQKGRLSISFAPHLMYMSATPTPADVNLATNSVIWNISDLKPGDQQSVKVVFRARENTPSSTVLHATAEFEDVLLSSAVNFNAVSTEMDQVASLETRSHWIDRFTVPGDTLYVPYVITNTGNGPDSFTLSASGLDAGNVAIYDDPNRDQFHQADESVIAKTPVLLPGESYGVLVELKVPLGKKDGQKIGTEIKAKSVFDKKAEALAANEIGIALPIVTTQTQLRVRDVAPGRLVAYQLSYENKGTGLAKNVKITDHLPAELEFVDADPQPAKVEDGTITWYVDELASQQKKSISVNVKIRPGVAAGRAIKKSTATSYHDLNGNVYR
ncbi:MAG: histone H1-like repetitive region-containing protein, partial [Nitrospirota bacterium]|nr:histone H1-like repetitive region-containing protein [Nitrospirota bacterium]